MKLKTIKLALLSALIALTLAGCTNNNEENKTVDTNTTNQTSGKTAIIKTAKGDIEFELYSDVAPKTVENFVKKANEDYYKGLIFHRVEDWVIQGGDPDGNGTGGGDQATELSDKEFKEGSVGVARAGDINVSNDSQFFICTTDCSFLTGQYTIFGQVTSGMDTAKKIEIGDKIESIEIK